MEPANKKIAVVNATSGGDAGLATKTIEVVELPTKTNDGGTPRSPKTYQNRNNDEDSKHKDPFLYYSNEANRLSYLLGHHNGDGGQLEPPTERKTRLSFEVHPDLLLSEDNIITTAATNSQLRKAQ